MLTTLTKIESASILRLQRDVDYNEALLSEAIALFDSEPEVALVLFKEVILSRK